jgi:hypothetical protein
MGAKRPLVVHNGSLGELRPPSIEPLRSEFVVSGRPRGTRGKGVRAITHAASTLALLRWCLDAGRPYPAFALIDSPLVVYREPDPDEGGFPLDVKDAFYRTLAERSADAQVVILENDAPPSDVGANVVTFTGTDRGRREFIPAR